jgi:3-hydroxyacyl-[acyl-carrier-protein] dehydratase
MTKSFLNSSEIKELIPHRYPFLFVDKIQIIKPNSEIVGIKNLSINEEVFNGHFPSESIFPGVLSVEACAQAAGILCSYSNLLKLNGLINDEECERSFDFLNKNELPSFSDLKSTLIQNGKQQIFYLTTIDETKFRKPMIPGAQLFIKVKVIQKRSIMWKFSGEIWIDDSELAVQTSFSAFLKQE